MRTFCPIFARLFFGVVAIAAKFRGWRMAGVNWFGIETAWESVWYGFIWISKIKN
jgi:hypothetical protein